MRAIDAEDKEDLAAFPYDEGAEFRALGGAHPAGENGFTTLERRYSPSIILLCEQLMAGTVRVLACLSVLGSLPKMVKH